MVRSYHNSQCGDTLDVIDAEASGLGAIHLNCWFIRISGASTSRLMAVYCIHNHIISCVFTMDTS